MLGSLRRQQWRGEDQGIESVACTLQGAQAPITTLDILPMGARRQR